MQNRTRSKFLMFNYLMLLLLLLSVQSTEGKLLPSSNFRTNNSNTNEISQQLSLREQINVQSLLEMGYNGSGIKIGIVDTGVFQDHSEFQGKDIIAKSFVTIENGYSATISSTKDNAGHGTKVAGIAAGKNLGIAPGADIVSAKIFEEEILGNGGYENEETSRGVVAAITWLVEEQNVSVINLSFSQYHNLVGEGRESVINRFSLENKVIFVASAANEGISDVNLGTIGNPGSSLQAITVGASEGIGIVANFTSNGPRVDWTMKPDVVAPGVNILSPSYQSQSTTTCSGTSCSAPVISGSVAVILSALKAQNIPYTPGMIKGALIASATKIIESDTNIPYPWWEQGAGLVDIKAALDFIVDNPNFIIPHPEILPFDPIDTMFLGQTLNFNLTLIASRSIEVDINAINDSQGLIFINGKLDVVDSTQVPVKISIPLTTPIGIYNILIKVSSVELPDSAQIPVIFNVKTPKIKILFDETHNGLVNVLESVDQDINYLQDPWGDASFLFGAFLDFFKLMTESNISVTPHQVGKLDNLTYLSQYDILILPYPATKLSSPFTDWYNDSEFFPDVSNIVPNLGFTDSELNAIKSYTFDLHKNIIIVTSYPAMHDIDALNKLLNLFQVEYVGNTYQGVLSFGSELPSNELVAGIENIPYIGGGLRKKDSFEGVLFAEIDPGKRIFGFASLHHVNGGNVLITGTGFFMENIALSSKTSTNFAQNIQFIQTIIMAVSNSTHNPVPENSFPETAHSFNFFIIIGTVILVLRIKKK